MWTAEASRESSATPEQVWRRYEDVSQWAVWDESLQKAELRGAFAPGSRGRVKPRGGPSSAFVLSVVESNRSFTVTTRLLLTTVIFEHELSPLSHGTRITHRVRISGGLQPLVSRILGKQLARGLPIAVQALANMAASAAP